MWQWFDEFRTQENYRQDFYGSDFVRVKLKSFVATVDELWGAVCLYRCQPLSFRICTPSYINLEGAIDRVPPEEQTKMARSGLWGHGIEDFIAYIEAWRAEGNMKGIEVSF